MINTIKMRIRAMLGRHLILKPDLRVATEFHGTEYGGWSIMRGSLNEQSRVISVGVGEDASFDLSLIRAYGCTVHAFDPTPKSIDWVGRYVDEPRFRFEPLALSTKDGAIRLFLPRNAAHVSASCLPGAHTKDQYFDAPCKRLGSLMEHLEFDHVDLLKIDIEGAEYGVVAESIESGSVRRVSQLLIEFHHHFSGFSSSRTKSAVASLVRVGFRIAWVSSSGREVLFVAQSAVRESGAHL